jgi:hypothetical protein
MGTIVAALAVLGSARMILMPRLMAVPQELLGAAADALDQAVGQGNGARQAGGAGLEEALAELGQLVDERARVIEEELGSPGDRRRHRDGADEDSLESMLAELGIEGGAGGAELNPAASVVELVRAARIAVAVPAWFNPACLAFGILGLLIAGVYMYACVSLLAVRPGAAALFCAAAGASVVLRLVWMGSFLTSGSVTAMVQAGGGTVGLVADLVLLTMVATGGKGAFRPEPQPEVLHTWEIIE